ncbi:PREDICTED: EF-hand calcium-binding domain-containing protein 11, partial [Pterocles gutturalis]|uniref:EF-hand calcium-binding domain-containing protein 11 n=1 Tax=Pterocles gutturalis TaxID=240206 RepID=UPI000529025C
GFEVCDEDKGYLSREDFKVALVMLFGYKPSKIRNGLLFETFLNLMSAEKATPLHSNETRQIFTAFDVQDRRFFLTFGDFKKAFSSVSPKLCERIIVEAFK